MQERNFQPDANTNTNITTMADIMVLGPEKRQYTFDQYHIK